MNVTVPKAFVHHLKNKQLMPATKSKVLVVFTLPNMSYNYKRNKFTSPYKIDRTILPILEKIQYFKLII